MESESREREGERFVGFFFFLVGVYVFVEEEL
jgi:hypothetical protein